MMKTKWSAQKIAFLAVLAALNVIAAEVLKFPIIPKVLELNFGFVPLAVAGMLFGPVPAMIVGAVGDIIGALIFTAGDFFFGYTLTAVLTGLFYGLFLYKPAADTKRQIIRILVSQLLVSLICFAGLNTLWAWMMGYGRSQQYIVTRLTVNAVAYPIYCFVLWLIIRYRKPLERAVKGH